MSDIAGRIGKHYHLNFSVWEKDTVSHRKIPFRQRLRLQLKINAGGTLYAIGALPSS
jgi:hypothetical protein